MPQISPISWIFIVTLLLFILVSINSNIPFVSLNQPNIFQSTSNSNNINW